MSLVEIACDCGRVFGRSRMVGVLPLVAASLALAAAPGAGRLWLYHRDAILSGHWWRWLTGEVSRWSAAGRTSAALLGVGWSSSVGRPVLASLGTAAIIGRRIG